MFFFQNFQFFFPLLCKMWSRHTYAKHKPDTGLTPPPYHSFTPPLSRLPGCILSPPPQRSCCSSPPSFTLITLHQGRLGVGGQVRAAARALKKSMFCFFPPCIQGARQLSVSFAPFWSPGGWSGCCRPRFYGRRPGRGQRSRGTSSPRRRPLCCLAPLAGGEWKTASTFFHCLSRLQCHRIVDKLLS